MNNGIKKVLTTVSMDALKPYPGNPRRNNKSAEIVAKSIKTYGYINPIIVTDDLMILAGHTRYKALKLLKAEVVEVLMITGLSKKQIDGFVIADNRVGEYSQWNYSQVDRMVTSGVCDEFTSELGLTSFRDNKEDLEGLINGQK